MRKTGFSLVKPKVSLVFALLIAISQILRKPFLKVLPLRIVHDLTVKRRFLERCVLGRFGLLWAALLAMDRVVSVLEATEQAERLISFRVRQY